MTQYKKWDSEYRKGWSDETMCVNAHRLRLKFDGGIDHKDGTSWAVAAVNPGFTILKIQVATPGLQAAGASPVSIDLGCVSWERGCQDCKPICDDPTRILDGYDVSTAKCGDVPCGPWDCGESCMPECCPAQMPADCCPPDDASQPCGTSDLVLTLHGTPAACSKLDVIIWYVMGH